MKVFGMIFKLFVVVVPLSLAGCLSLLMPKPAEPASNPANLDKYFQAKQGNHPAGTSIMDQSSWQSRNWQPGQFIVTGSIVDGKQKFVSRMLLVSHDGDVWVIETSTIDDKGEKNVGQIAASGYEEAMMGDKTKINYKWVKMMDKDGKVTKMDDPLGLAVANAALSMGSNTPTVAPDTTMEDGGDVTVPAGTFQGTALAKTKDASAWVHPGVPISPLVKAVSADGKTVTELLDFGFDGKPEITE